MLDYVLILSLASLILGHGLQARNSCTSGSIVSNNRQCSIQCFTDHAGGDYSSLFAVDFQACVSACSSDSNCVTAQYFTTNSYCYLKSSVTGSNTNTDVWSVVCGGPALIASSTPSNTSNTPAGSLSDSSSSCPLSTTTVTVSSCTTATTTVTVTACTIRSSSITSPTPTPIPTSGSSSVSAPSVQSSGTSTTTSTAICTPSYTAISGRTGAIQCGFDRPGGDLSSQYTGNLSSCETTCAANGDCLSAQYNGDSTGGTCYLKSSVNTPVHKADVNGIVFYTSNMSSPTLVNSTGCMTTAPPNPYLINGGWEYGWLDEVNGTVGGGSSFGQQLTNGVAFEGCKAITTYPTTNTTNIRYIQWGPQYVGLENGVLYNISFVVGRPTNTVTPGPAPEVKALMEGYIIYSSQICGWSDTGPCPVTGAGNASGQYVMAQYKPSKAHAYQAQDPSSTLFLQMKWTGASNDPVLLDDVRIVPA